MAADTGHEGENVPHKINTKLKLLCYITLKLYMQMEGLQLIY